MSSRPSISSKCEIVRHTSQRIANEASLRSAQRPLSPAKNSRTGQARFTDDQPRHGLPDAQSAQRERACSRGRTAGRNAPARTCRASTSPSLQSATSVIGCTTCRASVHRRSLMGCPRASGSVTTRWCSSARARSAAPAQARPVDRVGQGRAPPAIVADDLVRSAHHSPRGLSAWWLPHNKRRDHPRWWPNPFSPQTALSASVESSNPLNSQPISRDFGPVERGCLNH